VNAGYANLYNGRVNTADEPRAEESKGTASAADPEDASPVVQIDEEGRGIVILTPEQRADLLARSGPRNLVRAELEESSSNRPVGTVDLEDGSVNIRVADPTHRERIERIFEETGEVTWSITGFDLGRLRAGPGEPAWFHAILLQVLPRSDYVSRRIETLDSDP
jgi:hypothetical protein